MTDFSAGQVVRLSRKELREILRDRRTIVTLVLMPVLLYPLLGMAFRFFLLTTAAPSAAQTFRITVQSPEEQRTLAELLELQPDKDPQLFLVPSDDLEATLRAGEADVGVRLTGADKPFFVRDPRQGYECVILRRDDSPVGLKAEEFLAERLTEANIRLLRTRLEAASRVREPVLPVKVESKLIAMGEGKKPSYLATLIPLVLVLMTITGAVYPAIDLTAGERERGTLEILMAAPVSRVGLLLAKYVAVMTVATLTGVVNLTMMTLTLLVSGLGATLFPDGGLTIGTVVAVLALLLLFAAFFSAVLLAITSFARSFKEAQAYLIPVMLLAIAPGVASLLPGMRLGGMLTIVPLLNVVLLARELLEGGAAPAQGIIVVLSTLLYAFSAIGVAAKLFGAEAVLYSESAQVSDLFRRPRQARPAASVNAALFCLALMFPLAFILNGFAGKAKALPMEGQLAVVAVVAAALFVMLPLVSAHMGRVQPFTGFRLAAPPPLPVIGALLLGGSLWAFSLELNVLENQIGFSTMPESVRDLLKVQAEQWRSSPWMVLLVLAVITPLVEEFFFRGYLFSALAEVSRPRTAILVSALLFGVFHIFPGGLLLIERLPPSALMGLVLGWVRWRSNSIWPGVLLHVTHNALLLCASLFPESVAGLGLESDAHVAPLWLALGAAGAALGAALVWLGARRHAVAPLVAP